MLLMAPAVILQHCRPLSGATASPNGKNWNDETSLAEPSDKKAVRECLNGGG
jgi:hypothetical protein